MAINWKLKTYLAIKHSIYSATELKKKIYRKTGIIISTQQLCNIINKPSMVRLSTMEIICTALQCQLSDFLQIIGKKNKKPENSRKLSYKNTPLRKRAQIRFPDPKDYL